MIKNQQNIKTGKSWKSEKQKKWQNQKMQNHQKWENQNHEKVKKWSKNDPPLKMAKMSDKWPKSTLCEFRAAWSGVFWVPGGTTGPGFKAEIRPPLFLHFFDTFLSFFTFSNCAFWCFFSFHECDKIDKLVKVTFLGWYAINVIRPYYVIQGRTDVMCGGSPLFWLRILLLSSCSWFRVGEITQGRINYLLSFSPLLLFLGNQFYEFDVIGCRGDSQGSTNYTTLVLPSLNRNYSVFLFVLFYSCRGDSHGEENF